MNRRKFLLITTGAVGGIGVLTVVGKKAGIAKSVHQHYIPKLDISSSIGPLTAEDKVELSALIDVLVPKGIETNKDYILDFLEEKAMTEAGYRKEYQNGVNLLKQTANNRFGSNKTFSDLSLDERNEILQSLLDMFGEFDQIGRWVERITSSEQVRAFRRFVVRNILIKYYESPDGWKAMGYSHSIGYPSPDQLDYTRRPG